MTIDGPRKCKNPPCQNTVPTPKPGHKAQLTCSAACRKAASRAQLREAARRREEAARQQRLARWQVFLPVTQRSLERVEALCGPALAEQLAEAIRSEWERPLVTADRPLEAVIE